MITTEPRVEPETAAEVAGKAVIRSDIGSDVDVETSIEREDLRGSWRSNSKRVWFEGMRREVLGSTLGTPRSHIERHAILVAEEPEQSPLLISLRQQVLGSTLGTPGSYRSRLVLLVGDEPKDSAVELLQKREAVLGSKNGSFRFVQELKR